MPASERALRITGAYRARLARLERLAAALPWTVALRDIDATGRQWVADTATRLAVIQGAAVQLAAGYTSAYVASETGRPPAPPLIDGSGVGAADDGRPLATALVTAVVAVKAAFDRTDDDREAMRAGEDRARRMIASAASAAPRRALASAIDADDRIAGWRRVTRGGCGACLAAATSDIQTGELKVHPHCECTAEPVVAGALETVRRPTGWDIFTSWPQTRQDEVLGPEKAALIRSGAVPLERLIQLQPMAIAPDGITEAPLAALTQ